MVINGFKYISNMAEIFKHPQAAYYYNVLCNKPNKKHPLEYYRSTMEYAHLDA